MHNNVPIRLEVSDKSVFTLPVCALYALVFVAALMSSQPLLLGFLAIVCFGAGWIFGILEFSKANNNVILTSVIFPDGRAQLKSGRELLIAGFLNGRQWCTRQFAVLQISDGESTSRLIILNTQQREISDFRRLNMWLRQGMCDNSSPRRMARSKSV